MRNTARDPNTNKNSGFVRFIGAHLKNDFICLNNKLHTIDIKKMATNPRRPKRVIKELCAPNVYRIFSKSDSPQSKNLFMSSPKRGVPKPAP